MLNSKCKKLRRSNNAGRNHERNSTRTRPWTMCCAKSGRFSPRPRRQVNAINAKREQAMQDLRQAIANDSLNSKQPKRTKKAVN